MTLKEYLRAHPIDPNFVFKPVATFSPVGDMIEFYWDEEPAYVEPIHGKDGWIVGEKIIGMKSGELCGVKVFGVTALTELARYKKLAEENLDKTADGMFVVETDKLYCPKCKGEVRQEYDICYCYSCGNPDSFGESPWPLFYSQTLAKV